MAKRNSKHRSLSEICNWSHCSSTDIELIYSVDNVRRGICKYHWPIFCDLTANDQRIKAFNKIGVKHENGIIIKQTGEYDESSEENGGYNLLGGQ